MAEVSEVYTPAYDAGKQIDYKRIAEKIDAHLREKYEGQKIVIRPLSASEHHPEQLDDLIERIRSTGTDAKEPGAQGLGQAKPSYDFIGTYHEVSSGSSTEPALKKFYEKHLGKGQEPVKLDLMLVYGAEHVEKVPYDGKGYDSHDAYKFKSPDNKKEALKGIIKIKADGDSSQKPAQGSEQQGKAPPKEGEISDEELINALESAGASE
ncbi:hypothetical protein JXB28_06245 [Candidatus Woesearchaeota archaeon]|nr:hypothetical protein [Candidatus Woesearchaeota archaeon]